MTDVKREQLKTQAPEQLQNHQGFQLTDGVIISLTQAYCHNGHRLIDENNPSFLGFPGLTVEVSANGQTEVILISPVHGHHDRIGGGAIQNGTQCGVACPECHEQLLAHEENCSCGTGQLRILHLTAALGEGEHALVCDVWGCHRSRVMDQWELLSEFVDD